VSLRIFSDRACIPKGLTHIEMLYPFWGNPMTALRDPVTGGFDRYMEEGSRFFTLTSLEQSDVAVMPFDWDATLSNHHARHAAYAFANVAAAAGKPLLVFFSSDSDATVPLDAIVLRQSIARSAHAPGEFAAPFWNDDIVTTYCAGRLPVRARASRPVVSFCGRVPSRHPVRTALARMLGRPTWRGTRELRARSIDALRRSTRVEARVIERAPFYGDLIEQPDLRPQVESWRHEFVEQLLHSDYALCPRGTGHNYSFRFGEALCCGRIPVVVDCDVMLPYGDEVDWRRYAVWIPPDEIDALPDRIADFHARLSDDAFVELQHECRRIWQERLSPEGFFSRLHRHLPATVSMTA
jgi:hypothetical protein